MESPISININTESRIPKYQQVVNSIIHDIEKGYLHMGQKIPSINEISEEYYLSRDTVEKAYNQLKDRKIITSTKGKGYYVARTDLISKLNILFLLNKLSSYKMRIYNSFVNSIGSNAHIDMQIYHCDPKIFLNVLEENLGKYDAYVVMSHFKDDQQRHISITNDIARALKKIPEDRLILMDNNLPELKGDFAAIYQDFKMDIYEALRDGVDTLKKYNKLILVYPSQSLYPYPKEILQGFRKFCVEFNLDFEILDEIYDDMELHQKDAYVIIEEMDLVSLIKQIRDTNFELGRDIGIISYNDTPLKDLLGITVISTDFKLMGETAAYMLLKGKKEKVKNAFRFINRNSI